MGNNSSNLPEDPRIEKCVTVFQIPKYKISELWRLYVRFDTSGQGFLIIDDFFKLLLHYPRSPLTDAIPGFIETKSEAYFTFGEFVDLVCTFACFEQRDLIKFIWFILDARKLGTVEKHEIKMFFTRIWGNKPYNNLDEALEHLQNIDEDGVYSFHQLESLRNLYPNIFYPVYQLQQLIISSTLGESWWTKHKANLYDEKLLKEANDRKLMEKLRKEKQAAQENVSDEMLRRKMGIRYYLFPWMIANERNRLTKIAAIEADLEHQFMHLNNKTEEMD